MSPDTVGSLSSDGMYTAPASITSAQTISVTATSMADASKSASATMTLQSCTPLNFVSGSVNPSTVAPGAIYQLSCDYGANYGYILAETCGAPGTFAGFQGTAAISNCGAPSTPGTYTQSCGLATGPSQYYCARGPDPAGTLTVTVPVPDFTISLSDAAGGLNPLFLSQGGGSFVSVEVDSLLGFSGTVALSMAGIPSGWTAYFTPSNSIANAEGTVSLGVQAPGSATPGQYQVTITGQSGSIVHTAAFVIQVTGPGPGFTLSANPASETVAAGSAANFGVVVGSLGGFSGTVSNFSVSGLPAGSGSTFAPSSVTGSGSVSLTVGTSTGTVAGTYPLTINASSGGLTASIGVTMVVGSGGGTQVTITTSSALPSGTVAVSYSQSISATGGTPPYSWSVISGSLPPGLGLSASGVLSGTPTTASNYSFALQVTDSVNHTANKSFSLTISTQSNLVTILTNSLLPSGTAGSFYSLAFSAMGGTPPYSWLVASGTIPTTMTLSSSGVLSGTPPKPGSFVFSIRVADNAGHTTGQTFSVTVVSPPAGLSVSCAALSSQASLGETVTFSALAAGGVTPYSYAWSGAAAGNAQNVPFQSSTAGTFTAQVLVTDALNHSGPASCSLLVGEPSSTTPPYDCGGVQFVYNDPALFVGTDGTVFADFEVFIDFANAPLSDWNSQVVNAILTTPSKRFDRTNGLADGALMNGSQPSETIYPPTPSTLSAPDFGFGEYSWSAHYQLSNSNCRPDPVDWLIGSSYTIPAPTIYSLSPNNGLVGNLVTEITTSGQGLSGATDVAVTTQAGQPTGIVASFDPIDDATVNLTIDLTDPSVTPGVYNVAMTSYGVPVVGQTSTSLQFSVGDTTPIIDTVDQTPLSPNSQGSVVISGSSFGPACAGNQPCPGASLMICASGATPPCSTLDVSYSNVFWSDAQVTAQLNAGPNAFGFYDVRVVTAGATGTGFQQVGLPVGSTSNPGTVVASSSNLKLVVTNPNSGIQITPTSQLSRGQCSAQIDVTPQMPAIAAKLVDQNSNSIAGTITWGTEVSFSYKTRLPKAGGGYSAALPASAISASTGKKLSADQTYNADFVSILGGNATLTWTYNSPDQPPPAQAVAAGKFDFTICGVNPTFPVIDSALNQPSPAGINYWFARNITIHETNESQFCEQTRSQAGGCASSASFGKPAFGFPAGYGLGQLDPIDSVGQLFNWRSNVIGGLNRLDQRPGYSSWRSKVTAWNRLNTAQQLSGLPPFNPPGNQIEGTPDQIAGGSACTFTLSPDPNTGTTPNTGQPNTYWFGDAIVMKQTGGGNDYIQFNVGTGGWSTSKVSTIKVNGVPQLHNFVYEFCTCTAPRPSGCQSSTPPGNLQ